MTLPDHLLNEFRCAEWIDTAQMADEFFRDRGIEWHSTTADDLLRVTMQQHGGIGYEMYGDPVPMRKKSWLERLL